MSESINVYKGEERRSKPSITQEQLDNLVEKVAKKAVDDVLETLEEKSEEIAEKASKKAVEMMKDDAYKTVGKALLDKITWALGISIVALAYWLTGGK